MKVISMYLPQFHRVKENDEWWGERFTEWTTVKSAKKLQENQYQPRVPLNNNYYDLLKKETMIWQTELMKKYGIDAQCFYHYWFKDGRQILEKPAQNLLKWTDIDMPFCFCWTNETWARTWSNVSSKNPWANTFEKEREFGDSGILLEQKYGEEEQWRQHFGYLIDFFKDKRYIKIENKPVFLIYKTTLIPCLKEMIEKWDQWSKEEGFSGIYIIGANSNQETEAYLDAVLIHEPQHTMSALEYKNSERGYIQVFDYDEVWRELLEFSSRSSKIIYGGFVGYDDTPRRGKEGLIIKDASPDKFQRNLAELLAKNAVNNKTVTFINAWNEWGEGMYLEPDEVYEDSYLEAVTWAKAHYMEYLDKYENSLSRENDGLIKEIEFWSSKSARYEGYWRILDKWLILKEEQISLEDYFIEKNVHTIAIYGAGMLGKHLLRELKKGKIKVEYIIDRKADALKLGVDIYAPDQNFPEVDMIVVTATYAYDQIRKQLEKRGYKKLISLEKIIMEIV